MINPHDAKLEYTMIATLLMNPGLLRVLRLKDEHFYISNNRLAYQVMTKMIEDGEEINVVSFGMRFNLEGGKISEIDALFQDETYYSSLFAETYLKQLAELCAVRKIYMTYESLKDAPKEFIEEVKKLELEFVERTPKTLTELVDDDLVAYKERKKRFDEKGSVGLITGFKCIDNNCAFSKGYLITLAAKTSIGKSALALNIAINAAMYDQKVLFFSAEMNKEDLLNRVYAQLTGVSATRFKYCEADASMGLVRGEIESCGKNLKVIEAFKDTSMDIVRASHQESLRFKPDLIVVDYIQYLKDQTVKGETNTQRVGQITSNLHKLAQDLGCAVLALSQVNRLAEGIPELHHLRDSGNIEQDSDVVLILHRQDKEDVTAKLIIAKNRNGQADVTADLEYNPKLTKFYE